MFQSPSGLRLGLKSGNLSPTVHGTKCAPTLLFTCTHEGKVARIYIPGRGCPVSKKPRATTYPTLTLAVHQDRASGSSEHAWLQYLLLDSLHRLP